MAKNQTVKNSPRRKSVSTVDDLENKAGSPYQTTRLEVGDTCYVTGRGKVFVCVNATVGAAMWVGTDGELWSFDAARGLGQFLMGAAPSFNSGTFGSVAHALAGAGFNPPTNGDEIDIVVRSRLTSSNVAFTVTFDGTETDVNAVCTRINDAMEVAAGGPEPIAFVDPYDPFDRINVSSQVAGAVSYLSITNLTGTPMADILPGVSSPFIQSGADSAPELEIYSGGEFPILRIVADGAGALSSAGWFTKDRVPFQSFDMDANFSFFDGVTQTSQPAMGILFAGDGTKATAYQYAFIQGNPYAAAIIARTGDGTLFQKTNVPGGKYNIRTALKVRGAYINANLPRFTGQFSGLQFPDNDIWQQAMFTSEALLPYGSTWTSGPAPTNDRFGVAFFTMGTPAYRPIINNVFELGFRAAR